MAELIMIAKGAATLLTNEKARKSVGWTVVAILSPIIVAVALLCGIGAGMASHNNNAVRLCFRNSPLPDSTPAEYRACIEEMRTCFAALDWTIAVIELNMENGGSLDAARLKAVFFSLYFGGETPSISQFVSCFVTSEIGHTDTVYSPIGNMNTVYANIASVLGIEIKEEQKSNVDTVYSLIRYG